MTGLPGLSEAERRRKLLWLAACITQGAYVIGDPDPEVREIKVEAIRDYVRLQRRLADKTMDHEGAAKQLSASSVIGLIDSVFGNWQRTVRVAVLILTLCLCLSVVLNASEGFSEALAGVGGATLYGLLARLQRGKKP